MLGWERDLSGRLQITTKESQPNIEDTKESNSNNNIGHDRLCRTKEL